MKYISDTEILRWNDRLDGTEYTISATYGYNGPNPNIIFRKVSNNLKAWSPNNGVYEVVEDPSMKFDITFSISENRNDYFFDIFEKVSKGDLGNKVEYSNQNQEIRYSEIIFDKLIIESIEKTSHKLYEKDYTRYTYHFSGKLSSIIVYVMYIEDTIEFFKKIWGYGEDGKEYNLLKYPIGSVVSKTSDKSTDFIVLDYSYIKTGNKYKIDYICSEILGDIGPIIRYGRAKKINEENLCFSRNNRIDDILG